MDVLIALRPHIKLFMASRGWDDCGLVPVNVVQLRLGVLFWLSYTNSFTRPQLSNFGIWLVQISGDDRMLRADDDAGGFQTNLGAMRTVMAFGSRAMLRVHVNGVIGAGLHTRLAANAAVGVEIHDAVLALVHRGHRTNGDTRRLFAVIAAGDLEDAAGIRKFTFFDVLNPGSIHAQRDTVFRFAGYGASMATNAFAIINNESVSQKPCLSLDER